MESTTTRTVPWRLVLAIAGFLLVAAIAWFLTTNWGVAPQYRDIMESIHTRNPSTLRHALGYTGSTQELEAFIHAADQAFPNLRPLRPWDFPPRSVTGGEVGRLTFYEGKISMGEGIRITGSTGNVGSILFEYPSGSTKPCRLSILVEFSETDLRTGMPSP